MKKKTTKRLDIQPQLNGNGIIILIAITLYNVLFYLLIEFIAQMFSMGLMTEYKFFYNSYYIVTLFLGAVCVSYVITVILKSMMDKKE